MAREKVIKLICDRCGKMTLLPTSNKDNPPFLEYEIPLDWGREKNRDKDLCPECDVEYGAMLDRFYR